MGDETGDTRQIHPEMTILAVVWKYKETLPVFKKYDAVAGICLCCNALFDTLQDVAAKYAFDLDQFLSDLETASQAP